MAREHARRMMVVAGLVLTLSAGGVRGANWTGLGDPDLDWSNTDNWSDNSPPNGAVVFNDDGAKPTAAELTNVVSGDVTIGSLTFSNTSGNTHTTQINAGRTLTVQGGTLTFGADNATTTQVNFVGGGSLVVSSSGHNVVLSSGDVAIDLSGLSSFTAQGGYIEARFLFGGFGNSLDITLAKDNAFALDSFGFNPSGAHNNTLRLGETNQFHVNRLIVGSGINSNNNLIIFSPDHDGTATMTLRARNGIDRAATFLIGLGGANSGTNTNAIMDLTSGDGRGGGGIDALVNVLRIGGRAFDHATGTATGNGTLIYDQGTIDAISVILASVAPQGVTGLPDSINDSSGTITLRGSALLIADSILLGDDLRPNPTGGATHATVNLEGGTIRAGAIQPGTIGVGGARTFNWNSGTIGNKTGQDLTIATGFTFNVNSPGLHTFDADADSTITVNASLTGTGGITKAGQGTLILNGAHTYDGPTVVNAGTLLVNGSITSDTAIGAGATLGGSGTISGNVVVSTGGTHAPGNSPGIQSIIGDYTLDPGANLTIELNGVAVGTEYDRVDVVGGVNIDGANLVINLGYAPTPGDLFFIVVNDSDDPVNGEFAGLADGSVVSLGSFGGESFFARIFYFGDVGTAQLSGGNDIVLRVIPEPTSMALLALGSLMALRRQRSGDRHRRGA